MLVRLALVLLSLLVLGWVAVLLRDDHVGRAALDRLGRRGDASSASFTRDLHGLEDARFLNPDSNWDLKIGGAWISRGHRRRAARVLERLVRREPENFQAWAALYSAVRGVDRRRAREAFAELERLTPLGP